MATILIIDDDRVFCDLLSRAINLLGHHTTFALSLNDGLQTAASQTFDVIMLDVQLPDGNGLSAIPELRSKPNAPEVIIITGSGEADGAELAIKCGAWDYIEKPATTDAMTLPLIRALEYRRERQNRAASLAISRRGIIGDSPQLQACLELLAQAANSDINVLITGETGVGKELLARTIHRNSPRADAPFIILDCSALPESLVESILFGHEKGAFTGADRAHPGIIMQADGGTLFMDEVGELPLMLQKAFLRVLQEHCFRPIGGKSEVKSNFRLVAATNRNLEKMVDEGQFRADLLYRLRAIVIASPPLRQRAEDIKLLAMHHVARFCETNHIMVKGFAADFFEVLEAYPWPGNVRELFNVLDSALVTAREEPILYPYHLPVDIRTAVARAALPEKMAPCADSDSLNTEPVFPSPEALTFKEYRSRLHDIGEDRYLKWLIHHSRGSFEEACKTSGLSKSRLYYLLQKHRLSIS